jgi:hypothetical protein
VSGKEHTDGQSSSRAQVKDGDANVMSVTVVLSGEQAAAVEGWRMAHRMDSQAEAVRAAERDRPDLPDDRGRARLRRIRRHARRDGVTKAA